MNQEPVNYTELVSLAGKTHDRLISIRRYLHQHPELSFQEVNTTSYLRDKLAGLGLVFMPLHMETGVLAELRGDKPGPTVAIRSDIDALPITEQTELPFKSQKPGLMHACGHDMHMATVLGAAMLLSAYKNQLAGSVRFIFQPAEELPPGGARPMIENGALDGVMGIFGLHVDPHLPTGKISVRDGVTMASVIDFDLTIQGQSGHAARPHNSVDAIATAAEVIDSLQKVVSREIDPMSPAVITFGKIEGGTARNVIADHVSLYGTARALSSKASGQLPRLIKRTASGVCKARGAKMEMSIGARYPLLKNHSRANRLLVRNYQRLFGHGKVEETGRMLGGEDFACYLEKVPGAMFRLGVMNKKLKADKPWHSPQFIVDEQAIVYGVALLASAAIDLLTNGWK